MPLVQEPIVVEKVEKTVQGPRDGKLVISLGDSLTRGFQSAGRLDVLFSETPYTDFLAERCGEVVEFINRGVNGDTTAGMVSRFDRDVLESKPDYMLLLGGANDIGWGIPNENILKNLVSMLRQAQDAGIGPCACTVPPVIGWDDGNRLRLDLNAALAGHCAAKSIPWVDIYEPLADSPGGDLRPEFSGDGLHLTTDGYRAMADAIWDGFVSTIV
jgi:lysophospholipase L1-like esterase